MAGIPPPPPPAPTVTSVPHTQQSTATSPTLATLLTGLRAHHKRHKSCCDTPLHIAAFQGDATKLQQVLTEKQGKQSLNLRNHLGCTPLRLAVSAGNLDCVQVLLKQGADPNVPDIKAQSPVMMAVKNNHQACLRCLLKAGADPNGDINSLYAPLMWAAQEGNLSVITELLKYRAQVDRQNPVPINLAKSFPCSPARITLIHRRIDCFKTLLQAGAEQVPELYRCSLYFVGVSNNCQPEYISLMHDHGIALWDYAELDLMVSNKSFQDTPSWATLKSLQAQPYLLLSRCRIVIRSHLLRLCKLSQVQGLPLPQRIISFLEFQ